MRFVSFVLLISLCSCRHEFVMNTSWKVAKISCELQQIDVREIFFEDMYCFELVGVTLS